MYTKKLRSKSQKRDNLSVGNEEIQLPPLKKKRHVSSLNNIAEINDNVFESTETETQQQSNKKSPRKQRMASLNAIAKVNAVLCDYRIEKKEQVTHQVLQKKHVPQQLQSKKIKIMKETKTKELKPDATSLKYKILNDNKKNKDQTHRLLHSNLINNAVTSSDKSICSTDVSTQTDIHHKAVQTENKSTSFSSHRTMCTCPTNAEPIGISFYFPLNENEQQTKCPIHIKSNVLVHNKHSLSIPIIKQHFYSNSDNVEFSENFSTNVTQLEDNCLHNMLLQNCSLTAKLMYLKSCNEQKNKDLQKPSLKNPDIVNENNIYIKKELTVPSLNCPLISIPSTKKLNVEEKQKLKAVYTKVKEKKITNLEPQKQRKTCNGWVFEGASVHETFKQGNNTIVRKYYPSIHRQEDVIHLQDAVLLKSDQENSGTDYVARILEFWEDSGGIYAGEMMMSVLWYYKQEQMRMKYTEMQFEEMELFASRHKDDNSVACILDKCFVVSYSQFCRVEGENFPFRFRSQRQLVKESRTNKLSLVPQSKNFRSRWLPSPTTSISLVYFCRYGYDYRTGKILKQT